MDPTPSQIPSYLFFDFYSYIYICVFKHPYLHSKLIFSMSLFLGLFKSLHIKLLHSKDISIKKFLYDRSAEKK